MSKRLKYIWLLLIITPVTIVIILSGFMFKNKTSSQKRRCKEIFRECKANTAKWEVQKIKMCLHQRMVCTESNTPKKVCKQQTRNCILQSRKEKKEKERVCLKEYKDCIYDYLKGEKR